MLALARRRSLAPCLGFAAWLSGLAACTAGEHPRERELDPTPEAIASPPPPCARTVPDLAAAAALARAGEREGVRDDPFLVHAGLDPRGSELGPLLPSAWPASACKVEFVALRPDLDGLMHDAAIVVDLATAEVTRAPLGAYRSSVREPPTIAPAAQEALFEQIAAGQPPTPELRLALADYRDWAANAGESAVLANLRQPEFFAWLAAGSGGRVVASSDTPYAFGPARPIALDPAEVALLRDRRGCADAVLDPYEALTLAAAEAERIGLGEEWVIGHGTSRGLSAMLPARWPLAPGSCEVVVYVTTATTTPNGVQAYRATAAWILVDLARGSVRSGELPRSAGRAPELPAYDQDPMFAWIGRAHPFTTAEFERYRSASERADGELVAWHLGFFAAIGVDVSRVRPAPPAPWLAPDQPGGIE